MSKTPEGIARYDHLMHRMFVEYNRHLADCMHNKKSVGDRDREDAMAKAVQFLADNVSNEMAEALFTTFGLATKPTFWPSQPSTWDIEWCKASVSAALRAAAGSALEARS